jgi:alkylhydroperoxidase family enzyme
MRDSQSVGVFPISETRGHVSDAELAAVRDAGFDDDAIVEIAAVVAWNSFANLVNNLARTPPTPDQRGTSTQ